MSSNLSRKRTKIEALAESLEVDQQLDEEKRILETQSRREKAQKRSRGPYRKSAHIR